MRAGEIDDQPLVPLGQSDANGNVRVLEAVRIEALLGAIIALGQARQQRPKHLVGMIENTLKMQPRRLCPELVDETRNLLAADARRADHGAQVAVEKVRRPRVE